MSKFLQSVIRPLRSRKLRVAVATVIAAYLAEMKLNVSEELMYTILGIGVALITGIAVEDAGHKVSLPPPEQK